MALHPSSSHGGPWHVGQEWEKLGLMLPRSILSWAEIHAAPKLISNADIKTCLDFWSSRKVALVKQTAYHGAYLASGSIWSETVLTAPTHLGPMSFLADLRADYFIVRQAREPETYLWQEKFRADPDPELAFRHVRTWQDQQENMGVVNPDEIRWEDYDLVVSLDIALPARITQKCRRTLWAYYSVEAGGPLHKRSLQQPVEGYQLYLNHGFRRHRVRPMNRSHAIEFPFTFQSSGAWHSLAEKVGSLGNPRQGTLVERLSWHACSDEKPGSMRLLSGDAREYVRAMTSHQFAVRTDPKMRWGNWALEAVQAGCLFLGRADSLAMPGVLLPELIVSDLPSAEAKTRSLLQDPGKLRLLAKTQADLAEHLAFRRPLAELTRHMSKFLSP
jgi:hypothetical protein